MLRTGMLLVTMLAPAPNLPAWDALRSELYRFVARRISPPDAEDVVQEALLRIHRGLPNVRAEGAILGWLYQVTRNALVDHVRSIRPTETVDDDIALETESDDAAFARLAKCLAPFITQLPDHYREAVELVELRGLTQVAAAEQLGVPLSTLKSRVQRGRAQLRESLDRCCAIELDTRGHVTDVVPRTTCGCP